MKHYTGAHAAFFEAAILDLPTPILEWLAHDLPTLVDMVPHSTGGMLIKSSHEWMELTHGASSESLPDWCFVCDTIHGYILGGQVRDGCPLCLEDLDPERDSYLTPLLRIGWTLAEATDNKYFPELIDYLLCCHIKWRETRRIEQARYSSISVTGSNRQIENEPISESSSLLNKLKGLR